MNQIEVTDSDILKIFGLMSLKEFKNPCLGALLGSLSDIAKNDEPFFQRTVRTLSALACSYIDDVEFQTKAAEMEVDADFLRERAEWKDKRLDNQINRASMQIS